ncbi:MAG: efflux RND transporter periplasmic adaptor subunit [Xanthobacteraceae bacterium]|nr:efflux RND transporter periplasmic adaptor subunit [Xanthobacteraceae bacterium]
MIKRTPPLMAVLCLGAAAISLAVSTSHMTAQSSRVEPDEDERWSVVAPGRVEPVSGEIKIVASVTGVIGEVFVKANDTVFAGEPLIRLADEEAQARLAAAETQVALRRKVRNDENPTPKAAARRRAEDALADAQKGVSEGRAGLDKAAIARRTDSGSAADVDAARTALLRAQERLVAQKAELRKAEGDAPLPTQAEGMFNISRSDLAVVEAGVDKLTIRAPIAGTVLQVNAKVGELASPASPQPLVVLADLSALRVRAKVDERDIADVKIGQSVMVRPAAFGGREFPGKVTFISRMVEPGRENVRANSTETGVVEVLADLPNSGPLTAGMKADVYFRRDNTPRK